MSQEHRSIAGFEPTIEDPRRSLNEATSEALSRINAARTLMDIILLENRRQDRDDSVASVVAGLLDEAGRGLDWILRGPRLRVSAELRDAKNVADVDEMARANPTPQR